MISLFCAVLQRKNQRDNKQFHKALLVHGTTKDRVAALAFTCMENPVYALNDLFTIIDYVNAKFKNTFPSTLGKYWNAFKIVLFSLPSGYGPRAVVDLRSMVRTRYYTI